MKLLKENLLPHLFKFWISKSCMPWPSLGDPRYIQLTILLAYAIVAREIFHFERSHLVTFVCCLLAVTLDYLLGRYLYRKCKSPLSPLIIGLSSSLLIYSDSIWPYLCVATLAVLSKAFITYQGKHFYNPTNFGVAVILQFASAYATGYPMLFSGSLVASISFAILGIFTVVYAQQLEVSLSWLFGFIVFAWFRAYLDMAPLSAKIIAIFGPGFLLFTFHMISDPATAPKSQKARIAFGFSTAAIDALFRHFKLINSPIYSLFITSSIAPVIAHLRLGTKSKGIRALLALGRL